MSLPKFTTSVEDIDTPEDADVVFHNFTSQITREDLFVAAEEQLRERIPNSSVYTFRSMPGGMMGYIIGLTVMQSVGSQLAGLGHGLDKRLMAHYGFNDDSLPPRMLIREAVALRIRYLSVLVDIERMTQVGREALDASVLAAAVEIPGETDAYGIDDATADEILIR